MKKIGLLLLVAFCIHITPLDAQPKKKKPEIGIVQDLENDSILYASGYRDLMESISKCFSPRSVSEDQFQENLKKIKKLRMNLFAVNIFMPGDLKLVGPEVNEENILSYAEKVFQRCQAAGVKKITWGSGGARRVPDGFDLVKAKEQFIVVARKVAELAKKYNIVLALENLNSTETNFINTVKEAFDVVKKVNQPNFMLCADIYHMLKEDEPPAIIADTKKYLIHVEIAEEENRAPPGSKGEDFREYLKVLKKIGYTDKIILECRFQNVAEQAARARVYLQNQIDEVYGK